MSEIIKHALVFGLGWYVGAMLVGYGVFAYQRFNSILCMSPPMRPSWTVALPPSLSCLFRQQRNFS